MGLGADQIAAAALGAAFGHRSYLDGLLGDAIITRHPALGCALGVRQRLANNVRQVGRRLCRPGLVSWLRRITGVGGAEPGPLRLSQWRLWVWWANWFGRLLSGRGHSRRLPDDGSKFGRVGFARVGEVDFVVLAIEHVAVVGDELM